MKYNEAIQLFFLKLGEYKIMSLATSLNDYVMIRNVSCLFYNDKIYFKTDKNFKKSEQLLENSNVAMCYHGVSFEGIAECIGLACENKEFNEKYERYFKYSYNAYAHQKDEVIFEITPKRIEIWDQDENNYAFQVNIDTELQIVNIIEYDKKGL